MADKIVIFGGSGGMGASTARLLATREHELHLVGRNEEKLQEVAAEIGADHTVADVTDPDSFAAVAEAVGKECSGLVYAVGSINLGSLQRLQVDDFQRDFQINAMGAALAVKSLLPQLKRSARPASVVLYSSVAARQGFAFHTSIGMAKGAVQGLTLALAAELAPKIRVNAIAPSLTKTPLAEKILANEKMAETITSQHALKRLGETDDLAAMTAFLVSEDSGWITGQVLGVDGGRSTLRTSG
jgi:NAD(P)-dependent dehydrogenase (short-subunit alcohol dehydrogenase family)